MHPTTCQSGSFSSCAYQTITGHSDILWIIFETKWKMGLMIGLIKLPGNKSLKVNSKKQNWNWSKDSPQNQEPKQHNCFKPNNLVTPWTLPYMNKKQTAQVMCQRTLSLNIIQSTLSKIYEQNQRMICKYLRILVKGALEFACHFAHIM